MPFAADSIWVNVSTTGLSDFTMTTALAAYQNFVDAGVPNGATVHYTARTATEFENGEGVYNSGTGVVTRVTIFESSAGGGKVTFGTSPTLAISPLAEDAIFPPTGVVVDNTVVRWDGTAADAVQGSTVTINDAGDMGIAATTASISTATGALIVAGGVGIGEDLHIVGEGFANGVSSISGLGIATAWGGDGVIWGRAPSTTTRGEVSALADNYTSTFINTSLLQHGSAFASTVHGIAGATLGIVRFINTSACGFLANNSVSMYFGVAGVTTQMDLTDTRLAITPTTASVSVATGALIVSGGVGIAGNLSAAGAVINGTPTAFFFAETAKLAVHHFGGAQNLDLLRWSNDTFAAQFNFAKSRGATQNSYTIVQSGDSLVDMVFWGADGVDFAQAAAIKILSDGTPGSNNMPGRMSIYTTFAGAAVATERIRIANDGAVTIYNNNQVLGGFKILTLDSADRFAFVRAGSVPAQNSGCFFESLGSRTDANGGHAGRFGAAFRRADGTAVASGVDVGSIMFGGQHGTSTTLVDANLLYSARIAGYAEGSFTNATTMPIGLRFFTGSVGELITTTSPPGTERMRIASGGDITVRVDIATPAGGSTSARLLFGTTAGFGIYYGSGAPTVTAAAGSIYIRTDNAGANLRLYSNTTGAAVWAAITSA